MRLDYETAQKARIELVIYNLAGERVRTLVSGGAPAGSGSVTWDGRSDIGWEVPGGIYSARLLSAGASQTRKLVISR